ncbi:MAG: twin-arginine translocation signal domain-containing protein [Planctomycetota bacterium]|nr:twin-arginine translocation signal domain-containing protein [Planctomycetota bacterium]
MTGELNRRDFLGAAGTAALALPFTGTLRAQDVPMGMPPEWYNPPVEFSQAPFWFWNDDLSEKELLRQIEDFRAHGVHAFLIHPRAGLPRSIGWMSDRMIDLMRFTIERAAERDMWVILYDEGMYPSGSSSGQVVAENPAFRTRGLVCIDLDEATPGTEVQGVRIDAEGRPDLAADQTLVALTRRKSNGHRLAIVDRPAREGRSTIRGLHFVQDDPPRRADRREVPENQPPGADILNPESVACFIRLVYQRFYDEFGDRFGKTVKAIFTDEPSLLARGAERGMVPGTTGILEHINRFLGHDFTEHLPTLWYADEPDAERRRRDYSRAIQARLEETFYRPISEWCGAHGVALTGHPMAPDDIGHLRHFHIPGPRIDERPPDVGPNSPWWAQFKPFAQATSRLCWLNTDGVHVCSLAILGTNDYLPWRAAKVCFQHQRDFNYLEARHLWEDARIDSEGIHLAGMHYLALIVEDDPPSQANNAMDVMAQAGRLICWKEVTEPTEFVDAIDRLIPPDIEVSPETPDLRVRHMRKQDTDYYMLFNEGEGNLNVRLRLLAKGRRTLLDPTTGSQRSVTGDEPLSLARHAMRVLAVQQH